MEAENLRSVLPEPTFTTRLTHLNVNRIIQTCVARTLDAVVHLNRA